MMVEKTVSRSRYPAIVIIIAILLFACDTVTIYEESRAPGGDYWYKDSALIFEPHVNDTSEVVNVGFVLNHNNAYPYSNLWLFVEVKAPGGELQTDTLEYFLARPTGQWLGKGNQETRKIYWLYKGGVKWREAGPYIFKITQGMRRDSLPGINAFTLWIEKAGNGKE